MICRFAHDAMATRFELVLEGGEEPRLRAVAEQAFDEIDDCEARLSLFRPSSAVGRVNAEAHERWVEVDSDTFDLLASCASLHRASGGAFDITVGAAMAAHGFRAAPPEPGFAVGMHHVLLDATHRAVRFRTSAIALDLGAIGKGNALDQAAMVLREHGIARALLHGGTSTVLALGTAEDRSGFQVALGNQPDSPIARLSNAALSVSAQHGRTTIRGGEDLGHVLDPASGQPARRNGVVAAVAAPTATLADAWSTAFLVAGPLRRLPAEIAGLWLAQAAPATTTGACPGAAFEFPHTATPLPA